MSQPKKTNAFLDAINKAVLQTDNQTEPQSILEKKSHTNINSSQISNITKKKSITRSEKKLIGGHFDREVSKQLHLIAAEEETSIQALLTEALDLLFVKKGKSHIRDLNK